MKNILLIAFLVFGLFAHAQKSTKLFGKRFKTSISFEAFPLTKGPQKLELNMSSLLKNDLYITPRFVLNNEYQVKRNMALNLNIGYYSTALLTKEKDYYYNDYIEIPKGFVPIKSTFVQFGLKFGGGGISMPMSSIYYGFGLGFNFNSTDEFSYIVVDRFNNTTTEKTNPGINSMLPSIYAETGRRIIFGKGVIVDFGVILNLSHALVVYSDSELNPMYSSAELSFNQNMQRSVAFSSFLNFKIGIGLLY